MVKSYRARKSSLFKGFLILKTHQEGEMKFLMVLISCILYFAIPVFAQDPSGLDIMKEQKKRHESGQEYEGIKMVLIDSSNNKETRDMKRYTKKDKTGPFRYLARFEGPADIRGTALLTWEQKGREDDQWLYLPAYGQKLKRIAGGNKKGYFMGTDFAYEDLRPEKLEDHIYNLIRKEKFDNQECYVIEALPADEEKKTSGYAKRILWITVDTLVTLKTDFYDHSMKLLKTQTSHNIKTVKGKMMRADKVLMTHHQNKHQTLMGLVDRKIDEHIDDSVFTERAVINFK